LRLFYESAQHVTYRLDWSTDSDAAAHFVETFNSLSIQKNLMTISERPHQRHLKSEEDDSPVKPDPDKIVDASSDGWRPRFKVSQTISKCCLEAVGTIRGREERFKSCGTFERGRVGACSDRFLTSELHSIRTRMELTAEQLFHAIMAVAALSLAQQDGEERINALVHYQQSTSALQINLRTPQDLSSDGAFLTHFLLLVYEVRLRRSDLNCTDQIRLPRPNRAVRICGPTIYQYCYGYPHFDEISLMANVTPLLLGGSATSTSTPSSAV
jgi:hypothetical protein